MFTLVFERQRKRATRDYPSLDLCLRAANRMMADRVGLPWRSASDGKLLMASGTLHNKLRELDAL